MGLDMYIHDEHGNEVAYWRKFNALHAWFVTNLQDGVDECQRSRRITKEDIEQIIYIFKAIDEAPMAAQVLLPPRDGFFFGSTAFDEYLLNDVRSSIPVFERLLESVDREKFYYQSSW
jgi:hypothetical protein